MSIDDVTKIMVITISGRVRNVLLRSLTGKII